MLLWLQEAALVLKVLAFLVLVPLMLALPRQEEVVSAALVQGDQQAGAKVPPLQADPILHQVFLQVRSG